MIEIVSASTFYGRRAPGLVLLRNGSIVLHLTGRSTRKELEAIASAWR